MADNNTQAFFTNDYSVFPVTMVKHVVFPLDIAEVKNSGHKAIVVEFHVDGLEGYEKTITFQSMEVSEEDATSIFVV
jgi:hypothetical protein